MSIFTRTISATENYVDRLAETASNKLDIFKETAESSVETTLEKADSYILNNIQTSVDSAINSWFAEHPFILWLLHHPVISIIGLTLSAILIIRLFVALYKLITSSIDRAWLWILQSPFLLLKALFGWEVKVKDKNLTTTITNYEVTSNSQQLKEIGDRLDIIQQQQQQILQEIARLKQQERHIELKKYKLAPAIDDKIRG